MTSALRVLIAHPSSDVYGSDLQLVESVRALTEAGTSVVVSVPGPGPLEPSLVEAGASVVVEPVPVLRKSLLRPAGLARLAVTAPVCVLRLARRIRAARPDVVYVNTVTVPWWIAAARLARVPVLVHVHEAEESGSLLLRRAVVAPLVAAHEIVVNSAAALDAAAIVPGVRRRATVVHNGVPGPGNAAPRAPRGPDAPARLVLVARLSPRKGIDVAVEATALLVARGHDVRLDLCGTTFEGYEWYEDELRARAARSDLAGRVAFRGYVRPTWGALEEADVVLVPSRTEPFGNTAVEALLACRPLVASGVQGLREIVDDGRTGLLVPPGDAQALADAVGRLLDDPHEALRLALAGREDATERFSPQRYRERVRDVVARVARVRLAREPAAR